MDKITINGVTVKGRGFAYDGCHKIYIIEDESDAKEAVACGYIVITLDKLPGVWSTCCSLRFIRNWTLDKVFVAQGESATFDL